jgi:hypothetical protein
VERRAGVPRVPLPFPKDYGPGTCAKGGNVVTKWSGSHLRLVASNGKRIRAVKTFPRGIKQIEADKHIVLIAKRIMRLFDTCDELVSEPRRIARRIGATETEVRRAITYLSLRRQLTIIEDDE